MRSFAKKVRKSPSDITAQSGLSARATPAQFQASTTARHFGHTNSTSSRQESSLPQTGAKPSGGTRSNRQFLGNNRGTAPKHGTVPWYVRAANNSHGASKAALPSGSNAYDAMEEDGPVGGDGPEVEQAPAPIQAEQPPAQAEPAPVQAEQPPPQEEQAPAPAPAAPTITSSSVKAAPSGAANTRSRIGVGETVVFTGSVAGTWTASIGTASGPNSTTFNWTAPATAANTDATITLTAGSQTVTKTVTVVKPNSISMRNVDSHAALVGAGGACMRTEVTFGPSDVCLGAMQWLEVPGPATDVTGFFTKYSDATLHHDPNPDYAIVDDTNKMEAGPNNSDRDHCAWHSTAGPYSDGGFKWDIPNKYILDTEAPADGRHFTDTTQRFTMNAAGTMTITKAGAST